MGIYKTEFWGLDDAGAAYAELGLCKTEFWGRDDAGAAYAEQGNERGKEGGAAVVRKVDGSYRSQIQELIPHLVRMKILLSTKKD